MKALRDEKAFRHAQEMHAVLHELEDEGKIKIRYFDESGFTTVPNVPYAWQPVGKTVEIPSKRSKRMNILGFIGRDNEGFFRSHEESVTAIHVIAAFDDFAAHYAPEYKVTGTPCLVVLDNASMHRSTEFQAKIDGWAKQGVCLSYLPPYSPELNLIEILWRKIKYEWLPMSAYRSYATLKEKVLNILGGLGKKYTITFG